MHVLWLRQNGRVGLLYLPDHHAQTDAAGKPQDGDPGGHAHDGQAAEGLHPGIGAPRQTHEPGREAH